MGRRARWGGIGAVALVLGACAPAGVATRAAGPGPDAAPAPPMRANAEMAADILDLAFAMEDGTALPALSRWEGPVTVAVAGRAPPTLDAELDALLARLRAEAGLDVSRAGPGRAASVTVVPVPAATLAAAVPGAACFVVPNASSWAEFARGGAALDWARVVERTRAGVFVPADASPQELRDCLHEEVGQAVGPLNDLYRLPDSAFNDDNVHGMLTGFDLLAIRAINDPSLRSGMTRAEVAARLPAILARLNPAGERDGAALPEAPDGYARSMAAALAADRPAPERRAAAEAAVAMAQGGAAAGFALVALARVRAADDPRAAVAAFEAADRAFAGSPLTAIHRAHVAAQLAAYALADGDGPRVLALTGPAIPVARANGNARLLATLMAIRAEAMAGAGDTAGAARLRLDARAPARYGFGDAGAAARLAEVRALSPWRHEGPT